MSFPVVVLALNSTYSFIALVALLLYYLRSNIFPLHRRRRWMIYSIGILLIISLEVSALRFFPHLLPCGAYYAMIQTCTFGTQSVGFTYCYTIYHTFTLNMKSARAFQYYRSEGDEGYLQAWKQQDEFRTIRHRLGERLQQKVLIIANLLFLVVRVIIFSLHPEVWYIPFDSQGCDVIGFVQAFSVLMNFILVVVTFIFIWRFRSIHDNLYFSQELRILCVGLFFSFLASVLFVTTGYSRILLLDYTGRFLMITGLVIYPAFKSRGRADLLKKRMLETRMSATQKSIMTPRGHLLKLLLSVQGYDIFQEFLIKEANNENLLFWKEVNYIFMEWGGQGNQLEDRIVQLFIGFVYEDSPLMVNLSYEVRQRAINAYEQFNPDNPESLEELRESLGNCQDKIFRLLQTDPFRRFQQTDVYVQWLADQQDDETGRLGLI